LAAAALLQGREGRGGERRGGRERRALAALAGLHLLGARSGQQVIPLRG